MIDDPLQDTVNADPARLRATIAALDAEIGRLRKIRAAHALLLRAAEPSPAAAATPAASLTIAPPELSKPLAAFLRRAGLPLRDAAMGVVFFLEPIDLDRLMATLAGFGFRSTGAKPKDRLRSILWPEVGKTLKIDVTPNGKRHYRFASEEARAEFRSKHLATVTEELAESA